MRKGLLFSTLVSWAAAVVVVLLLAILGYFWMQYANLGSQREQLATRLRGLEARLRGAGVEHLSSCRPESRVQLRVPSR